MVTHSWVVPHIYLHPVRSKLQRFRPGKVRMEAEHKIKLHADFQSSSG